jgi:DNA repair protein RadC
MEVYLEPHLKRIRINSSYDAFFVMKEVLMRGNQVERNQEYFWVMSLFHNNAIVILELVSLGASNMVYVNPMEVFRVPLLKGAAKVILVHNHPGIDHMPCDLKPSKGDDDVTDRMFQVGKMISVPVNDHMIISPTLFYSYKDTNKLDEIAESKKWIPRYQEEERIRKEALKIGRK